MKRLACALGGITLLLTLPVAAQSFAKPEAAIEYRQGAMTVIGAHFGPLGAMATGKAPFNATTARANAEVVAYMSRLPWAGFAPGTDQGRKHRAKPEVWTKNSEFKADADKFQAAADKLAVAARGGNIDQFKAAFSDTAKTCKSCHDAFRNK